MRYTDRSLAEQMGLHELEISARKKLLNFEDADVKALISVQELVGAEIDEIIELFYLQLLAVDEVSLIIGDSDSLSRLKTYQRKYILDLFSGIYDSEYVNNRLRIGLVHKRIGVETKHYITAMAHLKSILTEWITIGFQQKNQVTTILIALEKLLNFDIQLVFDTFISTLVSEIESSKKKVEDYATSLETEVKQRTQELEELSQKDPMTGLYNRRALESFMSRDISLVRRNNTDMTALYLDMDGFKQINDVLGHVVGDELLVMISDVLLEIARDSDIVCRMGGDEFCVILNQCSEEQSMIIANRVVALFDEKNTGEASLSIGLAQYDHDDGSKSDPFISRADVAMYESKKTKGNAITRFSELESKSNT